MKVKCGSKDTKKKLCMRLLYPLFKYRMETVPEDVMEQMGREHNIGALLAQTSKDINISVGKLPEREYIQYLIDKGSSLPYQNDFETMIEDYVYDNEDNINYNPLYSIDDTTQEEIENMILEVMRNIYEDNPMKADEIQERINEIGNIMDQGVWAREKSRLIFRQIQEEKIYFLNKNFSGVDFSKIKDKRTDLRYVDFSNRNLSNANFTKVYLNSAILRGANLNNAILRGADLRGADLRNTQNFETIFQLFEIENSEENLIAEDDLIQIDDHTKFPERFDKENFINYFS